MSTLSFNVQISSKHREDILAFLLFCKKRGIKCAERYNNDVSVAEVIHWGILNGELTPAQCVELYSSSPLQQEIFEEILELQQDRIDYCESEFECFESDHPHYTELTTEYTKAHEDMERIRRFIAAVDDIMDSEA